jgi:hypothetical protein
MVTGKLGWRLAGWFTRSNRSVCIVPVEYSRARAGTRLQTGANKLCSAFELIDTKLIGLYKALSKSIREQHDCAELILWTSRTGD